MNEINKQVARARRRMMIGKFFNILAWAAFAGLLLAVIGMAIPKIWHLEFLQTQDQHTTRGLIPGSWAGSWQDSWLPAG